MDSEEQDERSPQEWLDIIDRLAAKFPDGVPQDDIGEGLAYIQAADVARAMLRDLKSGETSYFADLFAEVERSPEAPSSEIRELLVVGFIEGLQNNSLNEGIPLDRWQPWLGARTLIGWKAIADFWTK